MMKVFQIIVDFVTTFLVTAGGAVCVALTVSEGRTLSKNSIWLIVGTGLVSAAKGTRSLVSLPPLSNGNYEALKSLYSNQKPPGDKPEQTNQP